MIAPLPVQTVSSNSLTVRADSTGTGALVQWQISADTDALGFNVYRITASGKELVTPYMINGPAVHNGVAGSAGSTYSFYDRRGSIGAVYAVETHLLNGSISLSEPAGTNFRNELTDLSGRNVTINDVSRVAEGVNLESSKLALPADLKAEVDGSQQHPSAKGQRLVAASAGAKIGIKKDGFYRVTKAQLQSAGFDVNSNPANWQLFVDGNEQPIIVDPAGNFIEFFGRAINTVECDLRMYYLVVGSQAGKRVEQRVARTLAGTAATRNYFQTYTKLERKSYVNTILNGDAENWWGRTVSTTPSTFSFNLTGIDFSTTKATLRVAMQGFTTTPHSFSVLLNGVEVGPLTGFGQTPMSLEMGIPLSSFVEGTNTLQMSSSAASDSGFFDSIQVGFNRRYLADQNILNFYTENYRLATLEGFTGPNVRLFDITRDGELAEYSNLRVAQNGATYDVRLPAARGRVFYAIENGSALTPYTVDANNASSLRTPAHTANLVIITYKDYAAISETWANYRRSQGTTVEVVDADDIYDEFSYGIKNSAAITQFLSYAKSTWNTGPGYALIIGGASENVKSYDLSPSQIGFFNAVPTKLVNTIYTETGSDESVGDFNGDGLSDIAIGRIPGRTVADITAAYNKTVAYEAGPPSLNRGVLFAYDLPDTYDFQAMSERIRDNLPGTTPVTMIGRGDTNAQSNVIAAQNGTGKYLINYSGHGTIGVWASSSFFGNPHVAQLTNGSNPSVYTLLTCLNGYFLNLYGYSLAENLLESNGGAAAVWASTGKTTPDVQEVMASRFYLNAGNGSVLRIGDLILDAKSQVVGGNDVRLSWILMGDPMLKMH